jgi:hypothetical protein
MLCKVTVLKFRSTDEIYLVLDGTYFPNDIYLVVYETFSFKVETTLSFDRLRTF